MTTNKELRVAELVGQADEQATRERPSILPRFKRHNLHPERNCAHLRAARVADFSVMTADLAIAFHEIVSMIEVDTAETEDEDGNPLPGLGEYRVGIFERLLIHTSRLLTQEAEKMLDEVTGRMDWVEQGTLHARGPAPHEGRT